jgi:hypothetical protein
MIEANTYTAEELIERIGCKRGVFGPPKTTEKLTLGTADREDRLQARRVQPLRG